jgi:transcriptional regulator with XRE-family HTH domain
MARRRNFNGGKARDLREDKNIEVDALIERIGTNPKTGRLWHVDTIRNVELGHHQPSLNLGHAWARALGVDHSELLCEQDMGGIENTAASARRRAKKIWNNIENLASAQHAWRHAQMVHVRIKNADGEVINRLSTNAEDIARERVEAALAEVADAVIVLTLAQPEQDTP